MTRKTGENRVRARLVSCRLPRRKEGKKKKGGRGGEGEIRRARTRVECEMNLIPKLKDMAYTSAKETASSSPAVVLLDMRGKKRPPWSVATAAQESPRRAAIVRTLVLARPGFRALARSASQLRPALRRRTSIPSSSPPHIATSITTVFLSRISYLLRLLPFPNSRVPAALDLLQIPSPGPIERIGRPSAEARSSPCMHVGLNPTSRVP